MKAASIFTLATAQATASLALYDRHAPINPVVVWHDCPVGSAKDTECGTFDVPLNYANLSAGKATLAVARLPAPGPAKRLGTIYLNPGGPGGSGVDFVLSGPGMNLSLDYTDGAYDMVGYDPRGVGSTYPLIDCFDESKNETAAQFFGDTPTNGIEARRNFTNPDETDPDVVAFWSELNATDIILDGYGKKCLEVNGDNLKYVGTAATVRDLVALSEALEGPDRLINFWGFSYGTIIGAYFVNMFPDRVGRVIVDGVINPLVWATGPPHLAWDHAILDTDGTFSGFAAECAKAGPLACAIASRNSTEQSIIQWTKDLMDAAYDYKKAGGIKGSAFIRATTLPSSYTMAHGSEDSLPHKLGAADPTTFDSILYAVTCADAIDVGNITTRHVFQSTIDAARDVSQMFAPLWAVGGFYCHEWPARAVERFTGPFNHTTKTPILVIGNKFDPITPYAGARVLADLLGESAVIMQQDKFGHASPNLHSNCTIAMINAFFTNGTYPLEGQLCATDGVIFPQPEGTHRDLANSTEVLAQ